jgi:hypothetical protein
MVLTLNVDVDQPKLGMTSHTMARSFIHNRQAHVHGSFETVLDVIIGSDQDE